MEQAATPSHNLPPACEAWEQIRDHAHRQCKGHGAAFTPFREAILRQIAMSRQPRGAYEIAAELSQQMGKRIAPNSIYRVLDVLIECGLVQRVESRQAYCFADPQFTDNALLLMCEECGGVEPVDGSAIEAAMRQQARAAHFRPLHKVIEITGICEACDEAQARGA
jgi:Fur family zinc uptake transcriptional regulator